MANTYVKLQSASVEAGGSTEITFNNIPQTYTDLKIVVSSRRSAGNVWGTYVLTLNSNSNSIYSWRELKGDGASGSAVESLNTTSIKVSEGVGSGSGANIFDNTEIDILSYASNVNYKQINSHGAGENNATTAYQGLWVGRWLSYDPVTSVTIKSGSETFVQHTSITLYGIFNADVSSASATPTIGTAYVNDNTSAIVEITPVSNAASYEITSNPGNIVGTGIKSPIKISGLTEGTSYTFTAKSQNPFGQSAASAATNSTTVTGAYEFIAAASPGGSSTFSFTNIPQTYKHLKLHLVARGAYTAYDITPYMRFNQDTGNNYYLHYVSSNGSTLNQVSDYRPYARFMPTIPGSYIDSNNFAGGWVEIFDYTNSNKAKVYRGWGGCTPSSGFGFSSGTWTQTGAITRLDFQLETGNWLAGSHFALYGLR
jgi:hypothetical protein